MLFIKFDHLLQERFPIFLIFKLTHPGQRKHLILIHRPYHTHMYQRFIREHNIRRHPFLFHQFCPQATQNLKQLLILFLQFKGRRSPALLPFLFSCRLSRMLLFLRHLHGHRLILFQNKLRLPG